MDTALIDRLKKSIRDVPDFPKKGIIFKDITTLIRDAALFKEAVDRIAERYSGKAVDAVACIEARGFIFGGVLAYKLGTGLIPVRKKGKLPYKTRGITYSLEYGTDTLEMHEDAVRKGDRILLVDDLLATGGTTSAVAELIKGAGGTVAETAFLIELEFLKGRERLKDYGVFSLIKF